MDALDPPFHTVPCPNCGKRTIFDDEEPFAEGDRFWCSTCAHDLGDWGEVFASFYGNDWLDMKAKLAKGRV